MTMSRNVKMALCFVVLTISAANEEVCEEDGQCSVNLLQTSFTHQAIEEVSISTPPEKAKKGALVEEKGEQNVKESQEGEVMKVATTDASATGDKRQEWPSLPSSISGMFGSGKKSTSNSPPAAPACAGVSLQCVASLTSKVAYPGTSALTSTCLTNLDKNGWVLGQSYIYKPPSLFSYFTSAADAAYLWQNGNECLLAFRGSDDAGDGVNDLSDATCYKSTNANCKYMATRGFAHLSTGVANEFVPLFQYIEKSNGLVAMNSKKCTKLHVTGHSLGGALASVFAAWANQKGTSEMSGVTVDELYTFGAIPESTHALTNGQASNGCFNGMRFYDEDGASNVDFAPSVGTMVGGSRMLHPMLAARAISATGHSNMDCTAASKVTVGSSFSSYTPSLAMHSMTLYVERVDN